jgi:hypothetical protein
MSTAMSNKRQRMESPVEYEPYDAPDSPPSKNLAKQPWTEYELNPTEAQITEIVEKLDKSDVKKLLTESIQDLDEEDARKLLVNAAVFDGSVYIKVWGELTHIQLVKKDERARKIMERGNPPSRSTLQVQEAQQTTVTKQPKPSATLTPETVDIKDCFQEVDYIINERYAGLSEWKQYEKAGDAAELVEKEIAKLARRVTKKSYHNMKIDAILGLCKIGTLVTRGGNPVGDEVCKQVGNDALLVRTILGIADLMNIKEKRALNTDDMKALEAFDKQRKRHGVFHNFEKVLDALKKVPANA